MLQRFFCTASVQIKSTHSHTLWGLENVNTRSHIEALTGTHKRCLYKYLFMCVCVGVFMCVRVILITVRTAKKKVNESNNEI